VPTRKSDSTGSELLGWLIGILFVLVILDGLWIAYQRPMFYVTLAGIGLGLGTSFYFIVQLRRMRHPQQTEDSIIAWGGFVVWLISAVTAWLAVHHPLYEEPTGSLAELDVWFIHALQFIGMLFLFVCITAMALMQLITGSFYHKEQQGAWPGRIERKVWEWRIVIFVGVAISLIIAFLLSTGVLF